MSTPSRNRAFISFLVIMVAATLACGVSVTGPEAASSPAPAFDATKAALEIQATAASLQLTQVALSSQAQQPVVEPQTAAPAVPTQAPPTAVPTADIEAKIKGANILLYEDTDELGIGQWIESAIQGMGIQYTQTGSYSGHFMEYLNSGTKYDLIIVGAEDRSKITGEFWDVINQRLSRDKAGLIAELWYLEHEWNGPVSNIFGPCGVSYRIEYQAAQSVYWWDPTSEVFNTPNAVLPLLRRGARRTHDPRRRQAAAPRRRCQNAGRPLFEAILRRRRPGNLLRRPGDPPDILQPRLPRGRHRPALAELHPLRAEEPLPGPGTVSFSSRRPPRYPKGEDFCKRPRGSFSWLAPSKYAGIDPRGPMEAPRAAEVSPAAFISN